MPIRLDPWGTLHFKGRDLVAIPIDPNTKGHCVGCVAQKFQFICYELPSCSKIIFKEEGTLTPEETAQRVFARMTKGMKDQS